MDEYQIGKDIGKIKARLAALEKIVSKAAAARGSDLTGNLILPDGMPEGPAAAGFCEGTYECFIDGTTFSIGDRSTIGFYRETCPGSTSLGDGSHWRLIPGTCRC